MLRVAEPFRQSRASRFGQRVWRVELLTDLCH